VNWPTVKLGDLILSDKGGASLKRDQFTEEGKVVLPKKAVSSNYDIDITTFSYTSDEIFELNSQAVIDNSYLVTTLRDLVPTGPNLGRICQIKENGEFLLAQGLFGFQLKEGVHPKYIAYISGSPEFRSQVMKIKVGSTQVHARASEYKKIEFPLPPLAEQKRIAAILDKADNLRRKRQQAIKLADEFLRAVFLDMFGDPVTNPKGWEVRALGSFSSFQGGFAFKSSDYTESGIPLVKITNVHFENLEWEDVNYLPENFLNSKPDFSLEVGDLVMAMTRPIIKSLNAVKVVEVKERDRPCLLNQRVGRFNGYKGKVTKEFLKYFLYSDYFKSEVEKLCSVALQPNVSSKQIESVSCYVPPIEVQEKFSEFVNHVNQLSPKLEQATQERLFESLSQKAFAGEL